MTGCCSLFVDSYKLSCHHALCFYWRTVSPLRDDKTTLKQCSKCKGEHSSRLSGYTRPSWRRTAGNGGLEWDYSPFKKCDFQRFYDSLYLYKIDYKNYTFFTQKKKQTLKVWRLTEFNCIGLHATLGWDRGLVLWLGRVGLGSSGAPDDGWWKPTDGWT